MEHNHYSIKPEIDPSFLEADLQQDFPSDIESGLQSEEANSEEFSKSDLEEIPEIHIRMTQEDLVDFLNGKSAPLTAKYVLRKQNKKSKLPLLEVLNDNKNKLNRHIIIRNIIAIFNYYY